MFIKYLNIYQSIHIVFFCLTYNYTCSHKEQCFKTLKRPLLATVLFAYMTENIIITDQFFPLIKSVPQCNTNYVHRFYTLKLN